MKTNNLKIKKGDQVMIIAGKGRGKRSTIEKTMPKYNKVLVVGANISKHHLKPSRKNPHGGIMDKLTPIDVSNVIIICPRCSRPTRIGYKFTNAREANANKTHKIRICKKCQESID